MARPATGGAYQEAARRSRLDDGQTWWSWTEGEASLKQVEAVAGGRDQGGRGEGVERTLTLEDGLWQQASKQAIQSTRRDLLGGRSEERHRGSRQEESWLQQYNRVK